MADVTAKTIIAQWLQKYVSCLGHVSVGVLEETAGSAILSALAQHNLLKEGSVFSSGHTWRDISTAPRDGTEFQSWDTGDWEPRCRINPDTEAYEYWGRVDYDEEGWIAGALVHVTHWMPRPAPPNDTEKTKQPSSLISAGKEEQNG